MIKELFVGLPLIGNFILSRRLSESLAALIINEGELILYRLLISFSFGSDPFLVTFGVFITS
jgi:hypothetical protein